MDRYFEGDDYSLDKNRSTSSSSKSPDIVKGKESIEPKESTKSGGQEKKTNKFKLSVFLGILFSFFFSGYNTVFAAHPFGSLAFLAEQEIYIVPIFREIEIFSIEMIKLKKTKLSALQIRVMPLGDIFWADVNGGMRGHRGFI